MARSIARLLVLIVLSVFLVPLAQVGMATAAGCPTCGENSPSVVSDGKTFVGTHIIPATGGQSARPVGEAVGGSHCPDCTYRLVPLCELGNGCRELGQGPCGPGELPYAVYLTDPPAGEVSLPAVCLGEGQEPVSVDTVLADAERRLEDLLEPHDSQVIIQPEGGTLINVPTIVQAGGGTSAIRDVFFAAGSVNVTIDARPVSWDWSFGSSSERASFPYPGEPYASGVDPRTSGRHATYTYRRAGTREVQVVVRWEATFTVPGVGEFAVEDGVLRPSAPVPLQVYASRSELVAG